MQFTKAHGCGNDFIIVDALENPTLTLQALTERAVALCDRRFGVGADGALWVSERDGLPEMTVINSDGSLSEMCGNGLRCVAHHLLLKGAQGVFEGEVLTGAGALKVSARLTGEGGRSAESAIWMGHPRELRHLALSEAQEPLTALSMGNPHAVSFEAADFARRHTLAERWSAEVPGGVNLSFALITGDEISLEVHERGCGWTLACGTGACATVVAATERGLIAPGHPARVRLPGGSLSVLYTPGAGVWMTGPSEVIYRGVTLLL
jgi:diaminopimelate epimerase